MSETPHYDVLIVGAGHAGGQAAISLLQAGFTGTIGIVGMESFQPYDRPALSKDYFSGAKTFERLLLRPQAFWEDRGITFHHGHQIAAVEPTTRRVAALDGAIFRYGTLIWAAGADPRNLPCPSAEYRDVHTIRNRADVDRILASLNEVKQVVVIGGGYIGLEAAAVLRKFGKGVTLLEAQDRLLARVAGPALSAFFASEHVAHGVDVQLGAQVAALEGSGGRLQSVMLSDGRRLNADMVIAGIGVIPAIGPLEHAGADCGNGVLVDEQCLTSLDNIYAIGDCALHHNPFAQGAAIRLESVQNANDMAKIAAQSIVGKEPAARDVPWFWSNQYDIRLQTIGLLGGYDEEIIRGDPASRSFSVVYLKHGRVKALDCINATKDYVQGKELVLKAARLPTALLADVSVPLKSMLTAAAEHA